MSHKATRKPWNLDSVLSAMSKIITIAPEPRFRPCEPKINETEGEEVILQSTKTTDRLYEVIIDGCPAPKFQARQGLYRAHDDMERPRHSAQGFRIGPYDMPHAKEAWDSFCMRLHKDFGDQVHHRLREEALQESERIAETARGRLLQQELRVLFPTMFNDGEPLPCLDDHPNILKAGMLREETLGGELHLFPCNAEFRSPTNLGNWALFVVSNNGVEKFSSLQPVIVAAQQKVDAGPVAIVFTPWAVNAQRAFGTLTGQFSREQEDLEAATDGDVFSVTSAGDLENDTADNPPDKPPMAQDEIPNPSSSISSQPGANSNPSLRTSSSPTQAATDASPAPSAARSSAATAKDDSAASNHVQNEVPPAPKAAKPTKRRGNPGKFTIEQRMYMESYYDEFLAAPRTEKEKFWNRFFPAYFELFPLTEYPPPPVPKPLPVLSQLDFDAMSGDQKKARKKQEKRREWDPEQRARESAKGWFQAQQQKGNAGIGPFLDYMKELRKENRPRKRQLRQFLLTHPDYKDGIVEASKETGPHDRLRSRLEQAEAVIEGMERPELEKMTAERDEDFRQRNEVWVLKQKGRRLIDAKLCKTARESLPAVLQPLLEMIRDLTGYSVVIHAGIDTGNSDMRKRFQTISMCSTYDGAPEFVDYNLAAFQNFGADFSKWLQAVKKHQPEAKENDDDNASPTAAVKEKSVDPPPTSTTSTNAPKSKSKSNGKQKTAKPVVKNAKKRQRKGKNRGDESEEASEGDGSEDDEESPELDEDEDEETDVDGDDVDVGQLEGDDEEEVPVVKRYSVPFSPYELQRLDNIARNQQLLAQLGLADASKFLAGKKPQGPEEMKLDGEAHEKEKGKERDPPRPRPQRKTVNLALKDAGSALEEPRTQQNTPPTPGSTISNTPVTTPAISPPVPQPPTPDASASLNRPPPEQAPSVEHQDPSPMRHPTPSSPSPLPPLPAPDTDHHFADKDDGILLDADEEEAMDVDKTRGSVQLSYDSLTIPILAADESFDPIGSNSKLCKLFGPWFLSKPHDSQDVVRPPVWPSLVYKWIELQEKWEHDRVSDAVLPTRARIPAMKQWFRNGRLTRKKGMGTQEAVVLEDIREEWWTWWDEVNPAWRLRVDGKVVPGGEGDWEALVSPGPDGILLFLVALRWWSDCGGFEDPEGCWSEAAKSLYYTMDDLLKRPNPPPPHPEDEDIDATASGKRQKSAGRPNPRKRARAS
ncbi:hypothetical protein V5O48_013484 [Marasmius crinis-equi]|uniref:Uncharacterized protein n=1 Tax=Marasmius crinis-equi TaxID=585013 RepID=A0ABR3F0D0_9AGAR